MTAARLTLLAFAALLGACASPPPPGPRTVVIDFALQANGQPARCGATLGPLGVDARPATLRDARFYVQDLALIRADGSHESVALERDNWQDGQVALLDFEDASGACQGGTTATHHQVRGQVAAGDYVGLAFSLGVPEALNHTSTELQGPPLDIAAMGWSWQAGRKFAKLEVNPEGGVAKADGSRAASWYLHLGSTGCSGNPLTGETVACLRGNRVPVTLPRFDPARDAVALDLGSLLAGSQVGRDLGGAMGCMSGPDDPECPAVFTRLGLDLASGQPLPAGQVVFRVVPRP